MTLGACTKGQCWEPHPSQHVRNEVQLNPSLCNLSPGFPVSWTGQHPLLLSPSLVLPILSTQITWVYSLSIKSTQEENLPTTTPGLWRMPESLTGSRSETGWVIIFSHTRRVPSSPRLSLLCLVALPLTCPKTAFFGPQHLGSWRPQNRGRASSSKLSHSCILVLQALSHASSLRPICTLPITVLLKRCQTGDEACRLDTAIHTRPFSLLVAYPPLTLSAGRCLVPVREPPCRW